MKREKKYITEQHYGDKFMEIVYYGDNYRNDYVERRSEKKNLQIKIYKF